MKQHSRFRILSIASVLLCLFALAGNAGVVTLSQDDADRLRLDIRAMTAAFEQGDPEPLILHTHHSLKAMAGGAEAFGKITRDALAHLRNVGISHVSQEVGVPTPLYPAGEEEVCFVPLVSVMDLQGRRVKSTTFMIAIRTRGGTQWTYLDGAGLRKNPGMLHHLLPDLDRNVLLPPNTLEP